jgi:hypothetical protein
MVEARVYRVGTDRGLSVSGNADENSPPEFSESFDFDQAQPQNWDFGASARERQQKPGSMALRDELSH